MAILENCNGGGIILLGSDTTFTTLQKDSSSQSHSHRPPITSTSTHHHHHHHHHHQNQSDHQSRTLTTTSQEEEEEDNNNSIASAAGDHLKTVTGPVSDDDEDSRINLSESTTAEGELKIIPLQQDDHIHLPTQESNSTHNNSNKETDAEVIKSTSEDAHVMKNNYGREGFKQEMRDFEEMLPKLNPMAKEFVPPSLVINNNNPSQFLPPPALGHFGYNANGFLVPNNAAGFPIANSNSIRRKKSGYSNGKRRMNSRTSMAQREEVIRRTVYVSDIDHQVTEEQLAILFHRCGQVVDCRVCGDPNSVLRFAFIEFTDEEGAYNALSLSGTMLGYYPVKVQPSKTAIAPVNPTFLPQSEDEREMCARTIYCTNIDKKVTPAEIKMFFETMCGEVQRLRLLGDYHHSTRISFVEFVAAESAIAALNCSGAIIGSLPLRVSPSKTPVRSRPPRPNMQ